MGRALTAALVALLVGAPAAWADGTITAIPPNVFGPGSTTIDQGEKVTFQNFDIAGHDVVAHHTGDNGQPLFRSDLVAPFGSGPVVGTEYLTSGSYDFFCSIHPGMEATLEVSSAGTPVPRPEPKGGVSVQVLSKDLDKVVDSGKLKLRVQSEKAKVQVAARADTGKSEIALGSKSVNFKQAGARRVTFKLSRSARKVLRKRDRVELIATASATRSGKTERATARRTID
ncbi:MAG TPA: plastocyanin/azurin family copper-binding protein [Thermoleophilaceae bacterium]|nr:plastocyanin/azurin family copper-binding protein [Thermoleophilaceae bacterium]